MKRIILSVTLAVTAFAAFTVVRAQALEEIIVEAPPEIVKIFNGQPRPGDRETLSMTTRVSYADLNLKQRDDAAKLEKRIHDAAVSMCARIGAAYPDSKPDTAACAKDATERAMVSANKAIAAAGG